MKKLLLSAMSIILVSALELNVCAAGVADIFSVKHYTEKYEDVELAFGDNEEALYQHVMTYGLDEKRDISPVLDLAYYRANNPDLEAAFGDDWNAYVQHWITFGINEGRDTGKDFDPVLYLSSYPDLQQAFGNDYQAAVKHYIEYGIAEGRFLGIRYPETTGSSGDNTEEEPNGNCVSTETEYHEDGSCTITNFLIDGYYIKTKIDANGNTVKRDEYDSNDNIITSNQYEYDEAGHLTRNIYKSYTDGDYKIVDYYMNGVASKEEHHYGMVEDYYITEYNENGIKIGSTYYYANGSYSVYEYDDAGVEIKQTGYTAEGVYDGHYERQYNEAGELCVEKHYYADGNYYVQEIDNGMVKKETYYYANGMYSITEYNTNGEAISYRMFDSDGNEISEE